LLIEEVRGRKWGGQFFGVRRHSKYSVTRHGPGVNPLNDDERPDEHAKTGAVPAANAILHKSRMRAMPSNEEIAMITRERLEERIRGVVREFKRTERIPDPTDDELTAALEAQVDDLFDQEATFSYREVRDSARYVEDLRDEAQAESAEGFLREIRAWQETGSS